MENPIKMDDLGGTTIVGNTHFDAKESHGYFTWESTWAVKQMLPELCPRTKHRALGWYNNPLNEDLPPMTQQDHRKARKALERG